MKRTDSGYDSVDMYDQDWLDRFYNMFVDEFFYGPDTYEYQFGSFSLKEIEEMDIFIDELFEELFFGEDETFDIVDDSALDKNCNIVTDEKPAFCITYERFAELEGCNHIEEEDKEDWEAESLDAIEFHLQSPVKNIPLGMTINDVSGKQFEERVPLLKHFDTFDISAVPESGLPKMTRREKNKQKWKSKKLRKEQINLNIDPNTGCGKTYGKTDKGEIIILV